MKNLSFTSLRNCVDRNFTRNSFFLRTWANITWGLKKPSVSCFSTKQSHQWGYWVVWVKKGKINLRKFQYVWGGCKSRRNFVWKDQLPVSAVVLGAVSSEEIVIRLLRRDWELKKTVMILWINDVEKEIIYFSRPSTKQEIMFPKWNTPPLHNLNPKSYMV